MAEEDSKNLEQAFGERNETLRSFYNTAALELSEDEQASLTPILNSLKDNIARYREIEKIAEGGEKKITLVHDHRLDRRVAMARAVHGKEPQDLEQFLREARLTANLAHPNIMPVYNMGLDAEGEPFFSMELIPGSSLKEIINKLRDGDAGYRRNFPVDTLLNIYLKICDAIAYAHSRGVLHLDIKPDNIRVGEFGEVLVCDWGLARVVNSLEDDVIDDSRLLDGDVLNDMTLSGTMKGTPGFMAPEQTEAYGTKTTQTDVYALGALLYMLLTHKLPVEGASANEVIQNTREGRVVPIRRRKPEHHIPQGLSAVAMKALSLQPEDRYEEVVNLRQEIASFLSGHPTEAEHAGWITKTSLLLRRHNRVSFLLIFFLLLLAAVISVNLLAISREKAVAVAAQKTAEQNFQLYLKEQQLAQTLGEGLGEAVSYTVRSRDFVNAPSMIHLLETGLTENIDTVKRQNLYEQKGILHFVLQEFNAANESFDAAGKTKRIGQLRSLSRKYAKIKTIDSNRLTDQQLAQLFDEAKTANQMTLFYLYYHHMRRRPASAAPEEYIPLAGAVLDKLNYVRRSQKKPLQLTKKKNGYFLDLSRTSYSVFSMNIIGVYRRNVLAPFKLTTLDISHAKLDNLTGLRGLRLEELRMEGVLIDHPKQLPRQLEPLKLKRIVLTVGDYPKEMISELSKIMQVFDAKTMQPVIPTHRADAGSPESSAP
jgi:serine/threonine protein kinase